jgi:hypothetical protein
VGWLAGFGRAGGGAELLVGLRVLGSMVDLGMRGAS